VQVPKKVSEYNRMCRMAPLRILKEIRLNTPGQALAVREEAAVLHLVSNTTHLLIITPCPSAFAVHLVSNTTHPLIITPCPPAFALHLVSNTTHLLIITPF